MKPKQITSLAITALAVVATVLVGMYVDPEFRMTAIAAITALAGVSVPRMGER